MKFEIKKNKSINDITTDVSEIVRINNDIFIPAGEMITPMSLYEHQHNLCLLDAEKGRIKEDKIIDKISLFPIHPELNEFILDGKKFNKNYKTYPYLFSIIGHEKKYLHYKFFNLWQKIFFVIINNKMYCISKSLYNKRKYLYKVFHHDKQKITKVNQVWLREKEVKIILNNDLNNEKYQAIKNRFPELTNDNFVMILYGVYLENFFWPAQTSENLPQEFYSNAGDIGIVDKNFVEKQCKTKNGNDPKIIKFFLENNDDIVSIRLTEKYISHKCLHYIDKNKKYLKDKKTKKLVEMYKHPFLQSLLHPVIYAKNCLFPIKHRKLSRVLEKKNLYKFNFYTQNE